MDGESVPIDLTEQDAHLIESETDSASVENQMRQKHAHEEMIMRRSLEEAL